ncbi:MAG: hypothetical protein JWP57_4200 [Spirosoma sp.]|nr:hypothetical protein [Spirosoma sp.]
MGQQTVQLHKWYETVIGLQKGEWAEKVMNDPDNGIVFTRLANCAGHTVEMMLRLASLDRDPTTRDRVLQAMTAAMSVREE